MEKMKKKLLSLGILFCLVFAMLPLNTEVADAYGGEQGENAPVVTLINSKNEFYTLEYDSFKSWVLTLYPSSESYVGEITMDGNELYMDYTEDPVTISGIADGTKIQVGFAGLYPAMDSDRLDSKRFKLSYTKTTYSGKAKKPKLTSGTLTNDDLIKGGLVTVKYVNNTKPGIAKVIIKAGPKADGIFTGETRMYFRINPKKMTLSSLSSAKKGELTLKWKKQKYANGYQIMISESKDFNAVKTYRFTINQGKYTSMAFKEAKSGTKYFVKIRSYRETKDGNVYGAWSSAKSVTTK